MKALLILVALVAWIAASRGAAAQALVADLSANEISITTGFAGAELLLFGAVEGEGDVVVVVRGPAGPVDVRRKSRVLGIWINTDTQRFADVPSFYRVASSRPLGDITTPGMRQRLQIGVDAVRALPAGAAPTDPARLAAFRQGLSRSKLRADLWQDIVEPVTFVGPKLFRTTIRFPANVPTGVYNVEVFLLKDGREIGAQTAPMRVKKAGFGATIFAFAHEQAALHGLLAVALAVVVGWGASAAFRRG